MLMQIGGIHCSKGNFIVFASIVYLHFAEHFGCNKPPQHSVFKISLNKKVLMCNKISTNIIIIIYTSGFSYVFMHYVLCIIMFYPDLKRSIATCPR